MTHDFHHALTQLLEQLQVLRTPPKQEGFSLVELESLSEGYRDHYHAWRQFSDRFEATLLHLPRLPKSDYLVWASSMRHRTEVVLLEVDTVGIEPVENGLTRVAIADTDGNVLYDQLIKPTTSIFSDALRASGLTSEVLATAPTLEEVRHEIASWLERSYFVSFNFAFDRRWITKQFPSYSALGKCLQKQWEGYTGEAYTKLKSAAESVGYTMKNVTAPERLKAQAALLTAMAEGRGVSRSLERISLSTGTLDDHPF